MNEWKKGWAARITVREHLYYQTRGTNPMSVSSGYTRFSDNGEQPFCRWYIAKGEWEPLDLGWVHDHLGMLYIVNDSGPVVSVGDDPPPEPLLQLAFSEVDDGSWLVLPGESFRGSPSTPYMVTRSPNGIDVKFTVYGFPK